MRFSTRIDFLRFAGVVFIVLCVVDAASLAITQGVTDPYSLFTRSVNMINLIEALLLTGLVFVATRILEK